MKLFSIDTSSAATIAMLFFRLEPGWLVSCETRVHSIIFLKRFQCFSSKWLERRHLKENRLWNTGTHGKSEKLNIYFRHSKCKHTNHFDFVRFVTSWPFLVSIASLAIWPHHRRTVEWWLCGNSHNQRLILFSRHMRQLDSNESNDRLIYRVQRALPLNNAKYRVTRQNVQNNARECVSQRAFICCVNQLMIHLSLKCRHNASVIFMKA